MTHRGILLSVPTSFSGLPGRLRCTFREQGISAGVTPRLLFDRHLHRDRFQRIVALVARRGDNLVHHLHASKDFAEDGIGSIQSTVVCDTDIELRAVIVGVSRAVALPWHLGHGDSAAFMRTIVGFGIQPVAGTAGPVQRAVGILAQWVAPLNDESWNDTVKSGAIIEPHFDKIDEVFDVTRSVVRIKTNLDLAELRCDGNARIDFLKLDSHRKGM
jgi:hypothetical protein